MQACFSAAKNRENHRGCPVKLVQAWLSVRKQSESSFNYCGAPVMLIEASLRASKRASKHLDSNFHHCGSPVKLVEGLTSPFYNP